MVPTATSPPRGGLGSPGPGLGPFGPFMRADDTETMRGCSATRTSSAPTAPHRSLCMSRGRSSTSSPPQLDAPLHPGVRPCEERRLRADGVCGREPGPATRVPSEARHARHLGRDRRRRAHVERDSQPGAPSAAPTPGRNCSNQAARLTRDASTHRGPAEQAGLQRARNLHLDTLQTVDGVAASGRSARNPPKQEESREELLLKSADLNTPSRRNSCRVSAQRVNKPACPEEESNLYVPFGTGGFKPPASAVPPPGPGRRHARSDVDPEARAVGSGRSGDRGPEVAVAIFTPRPRLPRGSGPVTASSSVLRTRAAAGSWRRFAITMPSTMSASTSANARSRTTTATTGPPGSRRIVRGAPGRRGGDRNAGTVSPAARAAAPRRRTA